MDNEIGLLMLEQLKAIRGEMQGMRDGLTEVRDGLTEVRDEQRATNERLERLEVQQVGTNERLDRVERRQVDAEMRFGTAIAELQGATRELITETKTLGDRIDQVLTGTMGRTLNDVVVRVERLEAKVG